MERGQRSQGFWLAVCCLPPNLTPSPHLLPTQTVRADNVWQVQFAASSYWQMFVTKQAAKLDCDSGIIEPGYRISQMIILGNLRLMPWIVGKIISKANHQSFTQPLGPSWKLTWKPSAVEGDPVSAQSPFTQHCHPNSIGSTLSGSFYVSYHIGNSIMVVFEEYYVWKSAQIRDD